MTLREVSHLIHGVGLGVLVVWTHEMHTVGTGPVSQNLAPIAFLSFTLAILVRDRQPGRPWTRHEKMMLGVLVLTTACVAAVFVLRR